MEDVKPLSQQIDLKRTQLSPEEWLSFDQIPLTPVEPSYVKLVQIENLILFIPILIALPIAGIVINLPMMILLTLISLALLLACLISYGRYRYALSLAYGAFEHEFVMQKGILWHQKISLPYTRLQHVSLAQGPLERYFKQHTLKCFSAGSGSAEISLPGLDSDIAESLRQHLLAKAAAVRQARQTITEAQDELLSTQSQATPPQAQPSKPAVGDNDE
ncbi:PH domain-containing protein [Shewanella psychrotolerans]|uniref:PH domain-containing protein n=1 Tax=Shewanella psychrotolerans TaxID=2864206 RepID=UPI001C661B48|nr:PH domain-containing protein [Shewanella psychrotolerans]QYK00776.1 PH domain-containing protein [Shewanella psychrotolerans]